MTDTIGRLSTAEQLAVKALWNQRRRESARYTMPGKPPPPWIPSAEDRAEARDLVLRMRAQAAQAVEGRSLDG